MNEREHSRCANFSVIRTGAFPYTAVPTSTLLGELIKGHRLEKPEYCTDKLYAFGI